MGSPLRLPLCSRPFGAGRDGDAVDLRSPQLKDYKEPYTVTEQRLNELPVIKANKLIQTYVKRGSMSDAIHVFDSMPKRNVVSWNIIIVGFARQEQGAQALELYGRMHWEDFQPDARTFVATLKACSSLTVLEERKQVDEKSPKVGCLAKGRAIHSHVVKCGFESNVFVGTTLLDVYVKCRSMDDAQCVFEELPQRDVVTWNTMILGYAEQEDGAWALELYAQMHQEGVQPDARICVGLLKACSNPAELDQGKQVYGKLPIIKCLMQGRAIHSHVVMIGFELDVFVGTTLVDMYAKCGSMEDARCAFDELPYRDVVTWNAMILGYAEQEDSTQALDLYAGMHQEGVRPQDRTFVAALKACSGPVVLEQGNQHRRKMGKAECMVKGRAIHSQAVTSGFELDVFVGTSLVAMYIKCGDIADARHVFDGLPHHTVITWNTMILGYAEQEENEEAFRLHAQMQEQGLLPSSGTFVAILKACGNATSVEGGKDLHFQISWGGFDTIAIVAVSLMDMYAKCGSMVDAHQLFDELPRKDVVAWNALIAGYARHGESGLVFHLADRMRQEGMEPNGITILSVLNVCSHVGLVDNAHEFFQSTVNQYGIILTIEHYSCLVDLLGRSGRVEEAIGILKKMPFQPDVIVWLTVLSACQKWNNVEIGRHAFENIVRLDGKLDTAYVLMANIYANAAHVCRRLMI